MFPDPWLDRWLTLIKARAGERPVLEIGCGYGDDTATLAKAGLQVIGFDLSRTAVAATKIRVPSANITRRDVRDPLPDDATKMGVVLASLSLHYFSWDETVSIVERVRSALQPGGVLLCRLNSTLDDNFGAQGYEEIEPGYFLVDGQPKRFFDENAVRRLFADGWKTLSLEHITTDKYHQQKAAWEVILERPPSAIPSV
ncbi:putative S-adenosylmethionine-dependent methyltransferase/MSMEI_2290 [Burkholderia aenigmatica]|uniref:S-adenosylmethionine-dependent methyltransferase/MSMEI_2290 n=1 Tax=Burkholderia aenigmatica TaxID=2015348 RepID=A0ABY6Y0N1_9BURK|nr:putative S-adenosylmethionine-dependent methyltransferase/MSMEI_2290 [Burkholderia aenigmatica]VWD34193.1 putative S-adenosylmethionine-dependent methyltransferase/MSMEI_2290 [Burkholderia aenigmatica]